jgi:hypothetical protein
MNLWSFSLIEYQLNESEKEKIHRFSLVSFLNITSGAIHNGVPFAVPFNVFPGAKYFPNPKSVTRQ